MSLPGQCCGIGSQQIQFVSPELCDQFTKPAHARGVESVVPVPPVLAGRHQTGLLQQQQVLGDSRPTRREVSGQLPDRLFLPGQKMQQPPPVRHRGNLQNIQHKNYVNRR